MKHGFDPEFDALVALRQSAVTSDASPMAGRAQKAFESRLLFPALAGQPIRMLADGQQSGEEVTRRALLEITTRMWGPSDSDKPADMSNIPAAYTYFGQFAFHDMVFSRLYRGPRNGPLAQNLVSPSLDLTGLYGRGTDIDRHLYDADAGGFVPCRFPIGVPKDNTVSKNKGVKPVIVKGGQTGRDLPRIDTSHGFLMTASTAPPCHPLIADPRNDDGLILSQLQATLMQVHNRLCDALLSTGVAPMLAFNRVREFMLATYRTVIVNDYLRRILDSRVWQHFFEGDGFVGIGTAGLAERQDLPLEFSFGAARFAHGMVRAMYTVNEDIDTDAGRLEKILSFSSARPGGEVPIPANWVVDWRNFAELDPGHPAQGARRISPLLADELAHSTKLTTDENGNPASIAFMDCLKAYMLGLPSGQQLAQEVGRVLNGNVQVLSGKDILPSTALSGRYPSPAADLAAALRKWPDFLERTPPAYYFLQEASVLGDDGNHLGPTGSYIIAATVAGALFRSGGTTRLDAAAPVNTLAAWLTLADETAHLPHELVTLVDQRVTYPTSVRSNRRTGVTSR